MADASTGGTGTAKVASQTITFLDHARYNIVINNDDGSNDMWVIFNVATATAASPSYKIGAGETFQVDSCRAITSISYIRDSANVAFRYFAM